MIKITKLPNGATKRVQKCKAYRKGISSMGSSYSKGDVIIHFSSARNSGEVYTLVEEELQSLVSAPVSKQQAGKPY